MRKRFFAALLALCLTFSLLPVAGFAANDAEPEEKEVFYIRSAADMQTLAEYCQYDTWSVGRTVKLTCDLSLSGVELDPIRYFAGIFDGGHHTISDVTITAAASPCGIFAEVAQNAQILNLSVSGTCAPGGNADSVGGIAGINNGLIAGCSYTGSVTGGTFVGGIAGENLPYGCLENCRAYGSVQGSSMTGGLAGRNSGSILSCANESYVNITSVDPKVNLNDMDVTALLKSFTASSSDTLGIITDSGGIAGYNSGIIGDCRNHATVGYQHLGYNAGGIAGRSCGYVYNCENRGEIYGRKDIGGIVGQMEPYIELLSTTDLVANLTGQYGGLSYLLNELTRDAEKAGHQAAQRYQTIADTMRPVVDSVRNVDVSDPDSLQAAMDSVTDGLASLSGSMSGIGNDLHDASGTLADDMLRVNGQINSIAGATASIFHTLSDPENLEIIYDTSEEKIDEILYGKVEACTNRGAVDGDINLGGIVGQMSVESELNPEDNFEMDLGGTSRSEYEYRAIVLGCVNEGGVTARKNCAGGIVGLSAVGFVKDCQGYGSVTSENGDYVGGIAGMNHVKLADCWAKCTLSGQKFIGGIQGCGNSDGDDSSRVVNCISLVRVAEHKQFCGAISGYDTGLYENNLFVSDTLQGINGLSIQGIAQPISYEALLKHESLPEAFRSFTITFVADDTVLKTVNFHYGESFDRSIFPEIPEKADCFASWGNVDLQMLHTDLTVEAIYRHYNTLIASDLIRKNGRAAMYAEGTFDESARFVVEVQPMDDSVRAQYAELKQPWYRQIAAQFADLVHGRPVDATVCQDMVERLTLHIPQDGQDTHQVRYTLPRELEGTACRIYIDTPDGPVKADTEALGNYLCFEVPGDTVQIGIFSTVQTVWMLVLILVSLALICAIAYLLVRIVRKRRLKKLGQRVIQTVSQRTDAMSKERKITILVSACVVILSVSVAAVSLSRSPLGDSLRTAKELKELLRTQSGAYAVHVTARIDGNDGSYDCTVADLTEDGKKITAVRFGDVDVFYRDEQVYLPNGLCYQAAPSLPNQMEVLRISGELLRKKEVRREVQGDSTAYQLKLEDEDADQFVRLLLPELSENKSDFETDAVELTLYAKSGAFESLHLACTGETHGGAAFALEAAIRQTQETLFVPNAVRDAIAQGEPPVGTLTADLYDLAAAWVHFRNAPLQKGTMTLSADCNSVILSEQIGYFRTVVNETPISCLKKDKLAVYYNENGICTGNGKPLTGAEKALEGTSGLLEMLETLSYHAELSVQTVGDAKVYTLSLDSEATKALADMAAPATSGLDIRFADSSAVITLVDGTLTSIDLRLAGAMKVVRTEVSAQIDANIAFEENAKGTPHVPDAVKDALIIPEA